MEKNGLKDFSKDEYDEFISLFSVSNAWHLIREMLSEIGTSFLDQGERLGFITLNLAKKQGYDIKTTRILVLSSLFHDIGKIWQSSSSNDKMISEFDFSTSYDRALSSYLFLKYFSPLKDFSAIVLFQHGRYDRPQKDAYYKYGVMINLCDHVDRWISMGFSPEEIISLINGGKGSYFAPKDCEDMIEILERTNLIEQVKSGAYKSTIDDYMTTIYFRRDLIRSYLLMVTYCIEFYNFETMYHARLSASMGYIFSKLTNLDLHTTCVIYTACLFGDIGKVRISHEILEKPGKLTKEETMIMMRHIEYSKEILSNVFNDKIVVEYAYSHHERLDGSGYPKHLKGDEINLPMRVCAISDVIAAMIAGRSYKDAYSMDETIKALEEMVKENKIDKNLVQLYIDNREEIAAYLQRHQNRMFRNIKSLKAEREILKFSDVWER